MLGLHRQWFKIGMLRQLPCRHKCACISMWSCICIVGGGVSRGLHLWTCLSAWLWLSAVTPQRGG